MQFRFACKESGIKSMGAFANLRSDLQMKKINFLHICPDTLIKTFTSAHFIAFLLKSELSKHSGILQKFELKAISQSLK